ncbi:MAG: efflux RND transporter periplasmic adaptor subunit [Myxococcota bacterium]
MKHRSTSSLIIIITLALAGCSEKKAALPEKAPAIPAQVQKEPLQAAEQKDEIRLMGQVYSPGKMLLAFQTAGTIKSLTGQPGMSFKKGQVLAELDSKDIALRAEAAKLRAEQAQNQKKMAERDFKIEQSLYDKKITSKVQFENLRTNYDNAEITAKLADVDARMAQKALNDAKLIAPFDGVIARQMKSLGESSIGGEGGSAVYEIYETAALEIRLEAPESMLSKIAIGAPIEIEFPALKITLPAKVTRFVPVISDRTRNFTVTAILDKPDARVVPGFFVEGVIR